MDEYKANNYEKNNHLSDLGIKVLDAQKYNFNKNYSSRIQFHPFTYFYFVSSGRGKLSIENEAIDVSENDLIIINSNIGHTMYIDESIESCELIGFGVESISIAKVNMLNNDIIQTNFFHASLDSPEVCIESFEKILDEFTGNNVFARSMSNATAEIFIINTVRSYGDEINIHHDREINRQIDYIKTYIDNNYAEDIKLEDLSSMAYMNKFHLISEFKQAYRVTPIEYLILKRIEISKNLLISTNHSMEEISSIVGFNSQSYFNQVFKKKTRETPSQFRKKHRL